MTKIKLQDHSSDGMIGIDLFAGAGGLSLGAMQAGIETVLAIESDPDAAYTYASNHKKTTVVVDDITNIKSFEFIKKNNQIILFGGPPCQGYSPSNRKTRMIDNPKNWLFKEYLRCAQILTPDWIVIENVKGLVNLGEGFFLNEIFEILNKLGYTVNFKVLNAADFGVPQNRERIFIVASLNGIAFEFPKGDIDKVTVGEALADLPQLPNGAMLDKARYKTSAKSQYAKEMRGRKEIALNNLVTRNSELILDRYKYVPKGGNWQNIPSVLMKNYKDYTRCHHGIYRRLDDKSQSVTIGNYRKNMLIHPYEDRGLSVREAARLQSFPDWYEFKGAIGSQQQQVGNAVPPKLAYAVFKAIMRRGK